MNEIIPENPNQPYDIKDVIDLMVDYGEFLEIHRNYAKNIVVGFAKFNGQPVALWQTNQITLQGFLTTKHREKQHGLSVFATASIFRS